MNSLVQGKGSINLSIRGEFDFKIPVNVQIIHFWEPLCSYHLRQAARFREIQETYWKVFKKWSTHGIINMYIGFNRNSKFWIRGRSYEMEYSVMHAGFFGWGGSAKCFGCPFFEGLDKIFLIGEALKFGEFSQICSKIILKWKLWRKFETNAQFSRKFRFSGEMGKLRIIKYVDYNESSGEGSTRS